MAKYNPNPRTRGIKLLEPKSGQSKLERKITTRKFDVDHYEKTGELRYLEEGETMKIPSVIDNAKLMKAEITTIEQFNAVGNNADVANKYGVGLAAVNGWRMSLISKAKKEEKESVEMIQGPCSSEEITQGFAEMEVSQVEMNPSESYHVLPTENIFCADCGGLFVPNDRAIICQSCAEAIHQEDYPEQYEGLEESVSELEKQWVEPVEPTVEDKWVEVGTILTSLKETLVDIRRMKINEIEVEIEERLTEMMEGIA